ncbi:MAG: OmpH family outer membrane protein [Syntrophorhabdaceae bacterium]|nr:OmpH family outer membrane protein [Syntrophorhabdaceae bacterium]
MDNKKYSIKKLALNILLLMFLFITLYLAGSGSQVHAQSMKIGVFDLQKIIRDSKTIEGYRQEIVKSLEEKVKPIRTKEESLKNLEDKLRRQLQTLTLDERRDLEDKIANEVKEINRMKEDLDIAIRKMDRDLTQKAFKEIDAIVKNIAMKENYAVIFEKSRAGIAFSIEAIDITKKILEQIK